MSQSCSDWFKEEALEDWTMLFPMALSRESTFFILIIRAWPSTPSSPSASTEKPYTPTAPGSPKSSTTDGPASPKKTKILPSITVSPLFPSSASYALLHAVLQEKRCSQVSLQQLQQVLLRLRRSLLGNLHRMAGVTQIPIKL